MCVCACVCVCVIQWNVQVMDPLRHALLSFGEVVLLSDLNYTEINTVRLYSIPSGSFPYRLALFHTVWLFSIPSGSIPYRLALFHTVWLFSIPSGSIPYHLAPFHTVCLYSIQGYRSEGSRTEDTGPDYQANRQNTVHIHC